jgi:prepilin-type N-terminal cleavage/methylation domain-containing protein
MVTRGVVHPEPVVAGDPNYSVDGMRPFGAAFSWEVLMDDRKFVGNAERGMSLVELVVVVVVLALILTAALPGLKEARGAAAVGGASRRLQGLLFRCRAVAVMNGRACAVVFERRDDGSWRCFIAQDGDDDGIRRRDIDRLVDPIISEVILFEAGEAGLGILQGEFVPDPSGRGRLRGNLDDPVRAGRGDIITFTPRGTATPASIYFTDHRSRMRVLRVFGGTGRVISRVWRSGWPKWREAGL